MVTKRKIRPLRTKDTLDESSCQLFNKHLPHWISILEECREILKQMNAKCEQRRIESEKAAEKSRKESAERRKQFVADFPSLQKYVNEHGEFVCQPEPCEEFKSLYIDSSLRSE